MAQRAMKFKIHPELEDEIRSVAELSGIPIEKVRGLCEDKASEAVEKRVAIIVKEQMDLALGFTGTQVRNPAPNRITFDEADDLRTDKDV